ncbi:hypothetical protein Ais01nite_48400 [Asanoa ishikariensis]|uniref:Uncharacterized protein n=1 Tax=Asanoa ishikariensis TaxID=137265 RepID=A0A1H3RUI2_9ACTN|nr:hypothetical protein [Asanoa ishikariensis]GIF66805.1 hypothetical protein Ais01nite_48400 [Asanoa ishikariensis]SDZ29337.1 hypothetical protein SAMN05421684_4239 [Asanoa ishikariensis]
MKPGGSAALAIGAGYVLGRSHKLRAAALLAAGAAGGRLMRGGGSGESDQSGGGGKSGLLGKLGGAGRTAAIGAVTKSADRIGERLAERAAAMRQGSSGGDDK